MRIVLVMVSLLALTTIGHAQNDSIKFVPDNEGVYDNVEKWCEFPGGVAALSAFLMKNTKYPQIERDSGIEGKVVIKFVVDENGKVANAIVFRSATPAFDAEALRVIKLLPAFLPGRIKGKPVKVRMIIPFVFKLP